MAAGRTAGVVARSRHRKTRPLRPVDPRRPGLRHQGSGADQRAVRVDRRSMLITANQPFGEWGKIFPDQTMTLAAIDRLVHHATIFEMNVESYRRKTALERKRGPGRPPGRATINSNLIDAPTQEA